MPVQRTSNGGWRHLSHEQKLKEEAEEEIRRIKAMKEQEDALRQAGTGKIASVKAETGEVQAWASEGLRRVRSDTVLRKMHFLTGMAAIGGFLFGYDTGVISGALLPLRRSFDLTAWQQEVVVSSTVLAAFFSSLVGGNLNAAFGRRYSILVAAGVFTVGSLMLTIAWGYESLVAGRIVLGVGIGIASLTTPMYIAEVALPRMRGQLVTINTLLITFGQFTAGMVDGLFDQILPETGWRYMLGLAAIPSILMFFGFLSLPESPRWLAMQGYGDEAANVLRSLRETDQEAIEELQEILDSLSTTPDDEESSGCEYGSDGSTNGGNSSSDSQDQEKEEMDEELAGDEGASTTAAVAAATATPRANIVMSDVLMPDSSGGEGGVATMATTNREKQESFFLRLYSMLSDGPTRRALCLGCGIMIVQQCSGINTVMYYAASIYEMSQFDEVTAVWLSGFTALAQVLGIAISIFLVDRMGRRTLVLLSLSVVACSLIGLGGSFFMARVTSDAVDKALDYCASQPAMIWSGITVNAYDCVRIEFCGYCGGMCIPGNATEPYDLDLCPPDSEWIYGHTRNPYGWVSVFFMVLYLFSFGIGMGGMPWTITSEIYPLRHRSLAVSISTATNWIGNLVIAATFLSLSSPSTLTAYGAFWLYAGVAVVGYIWLYIALPETKGLSLEDIEKLFRKATDGYNALEGDEYEQERLITRRTLSLPTMTQTS